MKKTLVLLAVILLFPCVSEGAGRYLKIGADPVAPKKFNPKTEELYRTRRDLYVEITTGSGDVSKGLIESGTILVVDPPSDKALRIYECGNEILNEVYIKPRKINLYAVDRVSPPPTSGIEENIRRQVAAEKSRRAIIGGRSKRCFGVGTLETGIGSGGPSYGLASGNPLIAGVGAVVLLIGVFNDDSSAACKTLVAVASGAGGYLGGKSSKKSGNSSSSGDNNSSGGGGNNDSGGGNNNDSGSGGDGNSGGNDSGPDGPGPDPLP